MTGYEYLKTYHDTRVQDLPLRKIDGRVAPWPSDLAWDLDWFVDGDGQYFGAEYDEFGNCTNLYWFPEDADLSLGLECDGWVCCGHWCGCWEENPFFEYEPDNRRWT